MDDTTKSNLARAKSMLITAMIEHGVDSIVVEYSGSGDSGQIDDVTIEPHVGDQKITVFEPQGHYGSVEWVEKPETSFVDAAQGLTDALIRAYDHDGYENNDGGSGTVTIDSATNTIKYEHSDYYTESTDYDEEI